VQNPLTSLADDVAHTRRVVALQDGPVILAGHSFAGTAALAQKFPAPPASAGLVYTGGFGGLTEDAFLNDFANGVDPVWYAISRQDRTISPELQRFLAKRMHATTVEIDAGHLSLITHPHEVTQLILSATRAASQ
jgi:pimeloyl-ACP methyl ester carboxylesterase